MNHLMAAVRWLVMALLIGSAVPAAAQYDATATTRLSAALTDLQRRLRELPPSATRQAMLTDVAWFVGELSRSTTEPISLEYAESFERMAQLAGARPQRAVLDDLAQELSAKRDHCRVMNIGMGGTVTLQVHTKRGATGVGNLQVFYLLKIFEWVKEATPTNFPRLSTPTELSLAPGWYWVWARDPTTGIVSERTLVKASGSRQFVVDVVVP